MPVFYAHKPNEVFTHRPEYHNPTPQYWDTCQAHFNLVARLAKRILFRFPSEWHKYAPVVEAFAMLHDAAKLKHHFQNKLQGGEEAFEFCSVHTPGGTALAVEALGEYNMVPLLISGHHGGLPNLTVQKYGSYYKRNVARSNSAGDDRSQMMRELELIIPNLHQILADARPFRFGKTINDDFILRILFSICTKADHLATSMYDAKVTAMLGGAPRSHRRVDFLRSNQSLARFEKLKEFTRHLGTCNFTPIDVYRAKWFEEALKAAETLEAPVFTFDLPTGGGKTLAGLAFCWAYAIKHNLDRIFYIAPYLSIIDQNTEVFAKALGIDLKKNYRFILEHHSDGSIGRKLQKLEREGRIEDRNFKYERMNEEECRHPLVVTTSVQVLESMFTHKISRGHKWMNFANSILFFDEHHLLPLDLRKDTTEMISKLHEINATCVLSSATNTPWQGQYGIRTTPVIKIPSYPRRFRRVDPQWIGSLSFDDLRNKLKGLHQGLCVVNTRAFAQDLTMSLKHEHPNVMCLTTLQFKEHRLEILDMARNHLRLGEPILLISTQSIEAGVDIDFPIGYRQLAPFESIVQFCGRINRHGRNPGLSPAYVFENPDYRLRDIHYTIGSQEVRNLIDRFGRMDIYGKEFRNAYYRQIDLNTNNTRKLKQNEDDRMNIVWENSLNAARRFLSFRAVGQTYRLISDFSTSVVAYRKGELPAVRAALAAILDWNKKQSDKESDWQFIRSHQISMHQAQVENLIKKGHNQIEEVFDGFSGLYLYHGDYSELLGVSLADIGAE